MKFRTNKFSANFSGNSNEWLVETDEFLFKIRNLAVKGYKGSLKERYQVVSGKDIEFEFKRDWIKILKWRSLQKKSLYTDLYNPDKPRNLAKCVTVR